jgi:2-amino-4-hydroxy-6-hydroxymethyldihydropteridine diphosphokinase
MTDAPLHTVYLSLGSNLGNGKANVERAIEKIEELAGHVERRSALYVTEPWGFESEHLFTNAAVMCLTDLSPKDLLAVTQQIEREMGRRHKSSGGVYHDRVIDIDILLYDDCNVDEPDLKIPHPLMWRRNFVMQPLREIFPDVWETPLAPTSSSI